MNSFAKLATRLFMLFCILATVDIVAGKILERSYFDIKTGIYGNLNYVINQSNEELVVLGSSRALYHYNSQVLENLTGFKTLNAGYGGQSSAYYDAVFRCMICRYTPKIIVLDMISYSFAKSDDSFEKLSCLLPYYKLHPEIRSVINQTCRFEQLKASSNIYCYNSLLLNIFKEKIRPKREIYQGYIPLSRAIDSTKRYALDIIQFETDERQVQAFEDILKLAKQNNVKVILVISPTLYPNEIYKNVRILLSRYADNQSVFFLNYATDRQFKEYRFFFDPIHLNGKGADYFSKVLARDVISITGHPRSSKEAVISKYFKSDSPHH